VGANSALTQCLCTLNAVCACVCGVCMCVRARTHTCQRVCECDGVLVRGCVCA